jgi:hypothetical protein
MLRFRGRNKLSNYLYLGLFEGTLRKYYRVFRATAFKVFLASSSVVDLGS